MTLLYAGLDKLNTISCANCTGFSPAAVRAIGSMHGLVELNLRGCMPLGSLQSLTALQALTGTLHRKTLQHRFICQQGLWQAESI
jgi:hypothetical protein